MPGFILLRWCVAMILAIFLPAVFSAAATASTKEISSAKIFSETTGIDKLVADRDRPATFAQLDPRMMRQLQGMMGDPDFNEKINDFAEEHDMDPNQLKAMLAKQQGMRAKGQKGMRNPNPMGNMGQQGNE